MIGASPRRKEDLRLLAGAGRYADDIARAGAAHLGIVRSVHAHARITKVDLARARRRPGVLAAWSAGDLPGLAPTLSAAWGGTHKGRPFAIPILAGDRVRYVGEAIAVVVAEDAYRLGDALDAVTVHYEPLVPLADLAAAAGATRVHDDWADNTTLPVGATIGDAAAAFARAVVVVGGHFRHGRLAAVPIEPRGAIAWRDADTDRKSVV